MKLTCLTEGGNPLPELTWLRNGIPLRERSLLDAAGKFAPAGLFLFSSQNKEDLAALSKRIADLREIMSHP